MADQKKKRQQDSAFIELKALVDQHMSRDKSLPGFRLNDGTLRRFLAARSYNPKKALAQLQACVKWRKEFHPEDLHPSTFLDEYRSGKGYFWNIDQLGRPILICNPRLHITSKRTLQDSINNTIFLLERTEKRCEKGADKVVVIYNCKDVGMKNYDQKLTKVGADVLQTSYPERLAHLFVINEPGIVHYIWKLIRVFLDERVREKVQFIGKDPQEWKRVLTQYIDAEYLPTSLGGTDDSDPEYMRDDDPNLRDADIIQQEIEDKLDGVESRSSDEESQARRDSNLREKSPSTVKPLSLKSTSNRPLSDQGAKEVFKHFAGKNRVVETRYLNDMLRVTGCDLSEADQKRALKLAEGRTAIDEEDFTAIADSFDRRSNGERANVLREALERLNMDKKGRMDVEDLLEALTTRGSVLTEGEADHLRDDITVDDKGRCQIDQVVEVLTSGKGRC